MLCGVIEGLQRNGWNDVAVIAVETEGAASFRAATLAGAPVEIDAITSIARPAPFLVKQTRPVVEPLTMFKAAN